MEEEIMDKTSHIRGRIAVICGSLGHLYKGEYLIEPDCVEGVKDLIRLLKRDEATHVTRRCMGEVNIVHNHLIHIVKSCTPEMTHLLSVTLRLLINLTTPAILLFDEEIPQDKMNRHIYLTLTGHVQGYKSAFGDVELWNKVCSRLTNLFESHWPERSADDSIEIERILTLVRNVLQIPGDVDDEKRPDGTIHDKVLWALRESQFLELLLIVTSNQNEESYYLYLMEIFSLLLREQNPRDLAHCDSEKSEVEKDQDAEYLLRARDIQKSSQKKYSNTRNFDSTFVMRGVKSASNVDVICHKSLQSLEKMNIRETKKQTRPPRRSKAPAEIQNCQMRSSRDVRLFLKHFCLELLNSDFNHFMSTVKNRMDSGKSLTHDQTYYFWALTFFLELAIEGNLDVELVKNCLSIESFHFIQTNIESAFEHLVADKKSTVNWAKRIHNILKAYRSLLETLLWMDRSKSPMVRALSREIKSNVFFVVEYRELTLFLLLKYDRARFSIAYLSDLVQTSHLFIKLLEEFSKHTKLIVQKIVTKKGSKKKKPVKQLTETKEDKWNKIKDDVYDCLVVGTTFPEVVPFDATLDIPIDEQKGRAMKNIQKLLQEGEVRKAIGLLKSSRQVWPENDFFGSKVMTPEDEMMALQEICLSDLQPLDQDEAAYGKNQRNVGPRKMENEQDEEEEDVDEGSEKITEHEFSLLEYKMRLANKKVVENCSILLKNYSQNSDYVNHCALKLLHRIGWECSMPAMLYQASLFSTLLSILNDKSSRYKEINKFTINLMRLFRKQASKNSMLFIEMLFWKPRNVALEIQLGYEEYNGNPREKQTRKKKADKKGGKRKEDESKEKASILHQEHLEGKRKRPRKKKKFLSKKNHTEDIEIYEDPEDTRRRSTSSGTQNDVSDDGGASIQSGFALSFRNDVTSNLDSDASDVGFDDIKKKSSRVNEQDEIETVGKTGLTIKKHGLRQRKALLNSDSEECSKKKGTRPLRSETTGKEDTLQGTDNLIFVHDFSEVHLAETRDASLENHLEPGKPYFHERRECNVENSTGEKREIQQVVTLSDSSDEDAGSAQVSGQRKRRRFVSSGSEGEQNQESVVGTQKRVRANVIDSDSSD